MEELKLKDHLEVKGQEIREETVRFYIYSKKGVVI